MLSAQRLNVQPQAARAKALRTHITATRGLALQRFVVMRRLEKRTLLTLELLQENWPCQPVSSLALVRSWCWEV